MEPKDALSQATTIARAAFEQVKSAELEETVREFEQSDVRVFRSLAQTYRMLQRPFF
jgi:hypothetical protein